MGKLMNYRFNDLKVRVLKRSKTIQCMVCQKKKVKTAVVRVWCLWARVQGKVQSSEGGICSSVHGRIGSRGRQGKSNRVLQGVGV